jgi:hypothetical protein
MPSGCSTPGRDFAILPEISTSLGVAALRKNIVFKAEEIKKTWKHRICNAID